MSAEIECPVCKKFVRTYVWSVSKSGRRGRLMIRLHSNQQGAPCKASQKPVASFEAVSR